MRLIDADALSEILEARASMSYVVDASRVFLNVQRIVNAMPSVDATQVAHAHWTKDFIKIGNCDWKYKCSKCGKYNKQYSPPYCPHCGAKMDEKEDGHDASRSD